MPVDLIQKANEAFGKGDFEGAVKCFDELIENKLLVDPNLGYLNKGVALRALKRFEEAQACFDIVLQSDPAHLQALQYKAQALADMKKYDEAIATINEVLKLTPSNIDMLKLKINFLNVSKKHEEALEACDDALGFETDNLQVHVEQLLAQVNLNTTEANLGSDMRVSCDWFDATKPVLNEYQTRILGTALQQVGTYLNGTSEKKKAVDYYDRSIKLYPSAVAYFNRGVCLNQLKKRRKALKSFQEAVQRDPTMSTSWSMIGMIYLMKKDYFKSMHAYEKLPVQTKASLYNYGVACFKVARRIDAREKFEAALKIDPDFQHAKDALQMLMSVWKESDKKVTDTAPQGDEPKVPEPSDSRKYQTISYEDILARKVPKDWDFCNKDKYLSDEEFVKVLKMTREKYAALPKWKQNRAKKKVKLF